MIPRWPPDKPGQGEDEPQQGRPRILKGIGIGCAACVGALIAMLAIALFLASVLPEVFDEGGTPRTCEELAPRITTMSEERESLFSPRILKFYDIQELEATGDDILSCRARATGSGGNDTTITFYLKEDEDGDRFIGSR